MQRIIVSFIIFLHPTYAEYRVRRDFLGRFKRTPAGCGSRSALRSHSARNRRRSRESRRGRESEMPRVPRVPRKPRRLLKSAADRFDSRRDRAEPPPDRLPLRSRGGMQDVAAHIYPRRDLAGFSRQIPANVLPAKAEMKEELVSRRASNSFRRARERNYTGGISLLGPSPPSLSVLPLSSLPRFNPAPSPASSTARN